MPVTDIKTDTESLTLTLTAEFAAPVERIWQLYSDPRQLERVWGPPSHPATFVDHDLTPGGRVTYFMTSPEGEKFAGLWNVTAVDEGKGFAFEDAFADAEFNAVPDMPVSENDYRFESGGPGTVATYTSVYASAEALQQVLDMGMIDGATSAIAQIDDYLVANA